MDETQPSPPGRDVTQAIGARDADDAAKRAVDAARIASGYPRSGSALTIEGSGPPASPPGPRRPPTVPGYVILGELGRGGMGVVYHARQVLLNRPCALKMIIAGEHAAPEAIVRFLAEAEAVARIDHPNVVQIRHIGEADGLPFFELEYCVGGSLDRTLDGTPRPPRAVAELGEAIARGVGEAHRLGLVHRDLKPANVLLGDGGAPKVTDFGLVKALGSGNGLTRTDSILGSPSYMAPEQAGAKGAEVGRTADVYSLGAILYELATGRPPFAGATILDTLQQVKTAEPIPPTRLVPALPRDVETIALKCLEKDPQRRYASAGDLADELRRFLDGAPILARPTPFWERGAKWARRRPAAAAMIAAIGMLVTALLTTLAWSYASVRDALGVAEDRRVAAEAAGAKESAARTEAEAARSSALAETSRALMSETRALRLAREPGWLGEATANLRRLATPGPGARDLAALRSEAAADFVAFDVSELPRIAPPGLWSARRVRYSRDGALLAIQDQHDAKVWIWDVARARSLGTNPVAGSGDVGVAFDFTPDGSYLAYAARGGGVTYRPLKAGAAAPPPALVGPGTASALALDGLGRRIAVAWFRPGGGWGVDRVVVYDVATGGPLRTLDGPFDPSLARAPLALSPDGRLVAAMGPGHEVQFHEVDRAAPPVAAGRHGSTVDELAFNPDGSYAASASTSRDLSVKVWDVAAGREHLTLYGHTAWVHSLAFSPDGGLLASTGNDQTVRVWDVRTGETRSTIHPRLGPLLSVAFSPADGRIAVGGLNVVSSYLPSDRRARRLLAGHAGRIAGLAFDPVHDRLYSSSHHMDAAGRARSVLAWEPGTGRADPLRLPAGLVDPRIMAVSPDGMRLAVCIEAEGRPIVFFNSRDGAVSSILKTGHRAPISTLAFEPSSRRLATGSFDGVVFVWDLATGMSTSGGFNTGQPIVALGFLDRGRRLLVGGQGGVFICDADMKNTKIKAAIEGETTAFAVMPDEGSLVVACSDGALRVFGLPDLSPRRVIERAHRGPISALAVSPDGRLLVTAGAADLRIVLRDAATGREILTFPDEASPFTVLAFDAAGRTLAIGGAPETISSWDLARLRSGMAGLGLDWAPPASPAFPDPDPVPSPTAGAPAPDWVDLRTGFEALDEDGATASPAVYRRALAEMRRDAESRRSEAPLAGDEGILGRELACLYCLAGDRPGYERHCAELLGRRSADGLPFPMGDIAWASVHAPATSLDPERAARLIELAIRTDGDWNPWWRTALACARLRAGRWDEALRNLDDSDRIRSGWTSGPPINDLIRAIIRLRQGRSGEARTLYASALQRAGWPQSVRSRFGNLQDSLTFEVLRREAEALFLDAAFPSDPFAK